jgi:hypothetical protein
VSEKQGTYLLAAIFITAMLVIGHFAASRARWNREDNRPECGRIGCNCKICECKHCLCGRGK